MSISPLRRIRSRPAPAGPGRCVSDVESVARPLRQRTGLPLLPVSIAASARRASCAPGSSSSRASFVAGASSSPISLPRSWSMPGQRRELGDVVRLDRRALEQRRRAARTSRGPSRSRTGSSRGRPDLRRRSRSPSDRGSARNRRDARAVGGELEHAVLADAVLVLAAALAAHAPAELVHGLDGARRGSPRRRRTWPARTSP